MLADRPTPPDLDPAPARLSQTRAALHRLVVYVVSPAREALTGRVGLRAAGDGFATPLFGDEERQVTIAGDEVVRTDITGSQRRKITSLADAAEFLGIDIEVDRADRFDVPPPGDLDEALAVDATASRWLARWFAFGDSVLEALRGGFTADEDATIVQLWPEHFDLALSGGDEGLGRRANYGFSPGDVHIDEPYLYVGPWQPDGLDDAFWGGGSWAPLTVSKLASHDDPRAAALEFMRQGRDLLRGMR